jgi:hypothetical protein
MTEKPSVPSPASANTSSAKSVSCSPLTVLTRGSAIYRGIAKSSPAPSTSPRAVARPSPTPPLIAYSAEPTEQGSGTSRLMACSCGQMFYPLLAEQRKCSRCRTRQLTLEERRNDAPEVEAFNALSDLFQHTDDWQLVDPANPDRLVWASDLAKRYRADTQPRPVRNPISRWL